MDRSEKFRQMRQSSARKLNTYVLPTPLEKSPTTSKTNNLWHSSPLERMNKFSGPIPSNTQSVLKEINNNSKPTPLPSPTQIDPNSSFNAKKIKRYAFSGPLAGSVQSNKSPLLSASGPIGTPLTRPASTTKLSSLSGSFVSSPKISELHELPRPPANLASMRPPSKAGFSAPLVSFRSGPDLNVTNKSPAAAAAAASELPVPHETERMVSLSPSPPRTPVPIRNS